jgi:hypothetical protein
MSIINIDQKKFKKQHDRIPEGSAKALELLPFVSAIFLMTLVALDQTGWRLIGCLAVIVVLFASMAYRDCVARLIRYLLHPKAS